MTNWSTAEWGVFHKVTWFIFTLWCFRDPDGVGFSTPYVLYLRLKAF